MEYQLEKFMELNVFAKAKAALFLNRDGLTELGSIVCRHGLHHFLGINLLHRHFDLRHSERLARSWMLLLTQPYCVVERF